MTASSTALRLRYGALGVVAAIAAWQLVTTVWLTSNAQLAAPYDVAVALADLVADTTFWLELLHTTQAWALGLLISMVAGTAFGVVIEPPPVSWRL